MSDRMLPTRRREPIAMTALAWRCAELIDLCAAIKDPVEARLGWATMQEALFEASNKLDAHLRGLRARLSDQGALEVEAQQPTEESK